MMFSFQEMMGVKFGREFSQKEMPVEVCKLPMIF